MVKPHSEYKHIYRIMEMTSDYIYSLIGTYESRL